MRVFLLFCLVTLLSACNVPSVILATETAISKPTARPQSDWTLIEDGLEWRRLSPHGDELAQLIVVRINPQYFRFRAAYRAGDPQSLASWRELEPEASVIINANFFDRENRALGTVISDGVAHGTAYLDRGGTFLLRSAVPSVIGYRSHSLRIDRSVEQAIQGFPLLVDRGKQSYADARASERNRRTLIAEDANGNILIMVSPFLGLSLADLSAYLATADLEIVTAVNLDGGGSTMIAIPGIEYFQPSFDAVPTILAVYAR